MSYYVGDIPAAGIVVEPARNGEPIPLAPFTTATATLRNDIGAIVPAVPLTAVINQPAQTVLVSWPPAITPFATAGVYYISVVLNGVAKSERVATIPIVVEDEQDGWLTLDSIRDAWPDAPAADITLFELLWTAKQQCLTYAPALLPTDRPPLNYKMGQQMQARNIWNANKVAPDSGGFGEGSFVIRPFPLDWMVKQMLRPAPAIPRIG